jgi:hypothetical protein
MARRTAGTIVRNAATLAGNTMLVLTHIHASEPFPSDYTHEQPVPPTTVNAAFVQSRRALAGYRFAVPGGSGPVDRDELAPMGCASDRRGV